MDSLFFFNKMNSLRKMVKKWRYVGGMGLAHILTRCKQDILYILVTLFPTWKDKKTMFQISNLPLHFKTNKTFNFIHGHL
jgi:hypothetical protein